MFETISWFNIEDLIAGLSFKASRRKFFRRPWAKGRQLISIIKKFNCIVFYNWSMKIKTCKTLLVSTELEIRQKRKKKLLISWMLFVFTLRLLKIVTRKYYSFKNENCADKKETVVWKQAKTWIHTPFFNVSQRVW